MINCNSEIIISTRIDFTKKLINNITIKVEFLILLFLFIYKKNSCKILLTYY